MSCNNVHTYVYKVHGKIKNGEHCLMMKISLHFHIHSVFPLLYINVESRRDDISLSFKKIKLIKIS